MKIPAKFVRGNLTDTTTKPCLLDKKYWHKHSAVFGLDTDKDVVMFSAGPEVLTSGHAADTHDGIRDGASHNLKLDWTGNYLMYCTLDSWLAAGNDKPAF